MPVPSATKTTVVAPEAAPNRRSASAAAFTSCSTTTGRPSRSVIRSATGASRHARCGANRTPRRSGVTNPASASPTAPTGCRCASSVTTPATAASSASSLRGVEVRAVSMISPSASTTPARTRVPPTSTPTVSTTAPARPRCAGRPAPVARAASGLRPVWRGRSAARPSAGRVPRHLRQRVGGPCARPRTPRQTGHEVHRCSGAPPSRTRSTPGPARRHRLGQAVDQRIQPVSASSPQRAQLLHHGRPRGSARRLRPARHSRLPRR